MRAAVHAITPADGDDIGHEENRRRRTPANSIPANPSRGPTRPYCIPGERRMHHPFVRAHCTSLKLPPTPDTPTPSYLWLSVIVALLPKLKFLAMIWVQSLLAFELRVTCALGA